MNRALAGHVDVLAEVALLGDVVVVTVHRHVGRRKIRERLAQRVQHLLHHRLAVGARVLLRPADCADVVDEALAPFREVGEVGVRQVDEPPLHIALGALDEVAAELVADAARARVQHHPHRPVLIEAELDEVVSGAQRAQVPEPARVRGLGVLVDHRGVAGLELGPARQSP
jgi:hypothetical protein